MADDLVGALGPNEWVGAVVPAVDVGADGGFEVFDAVERAAVDGLAVMIPKKNSMFNQLPLVGVKCKSPAGDLASHARTLGCLWVA